ncbi:MAG: Crp/Fnr family transcriptional regulator [Actinomycetota bacterium]|nr:Crp/Fnr family transcriptional regulator [Actinomycetota bacterium]
MLKHHIGVSDGITTSGHIGLEDLEDAGVKTAERVFRAKDLIFAPGDPDGQLYFLLEGTVRLYKIYGEYKEATVAMLKDRGVFGELGLDEGSRQRCFAEAVTETRVAVVRKRVLVETIKGDPSLATKLLFSFSDRLRQSDEAIESLLSREVSARLARLLLNLGERFGEASGPGTVLKVRLTHQDLANMIVSTREAVSKVMSEFQRLGLIEVRNRRICITPRLEEARSLSPRTAQEVAQ